MDRVLSHHPHLAAPRGPVVLAILDGVGVGRGDEGDAVALARTPTLDRLRAGPYRTLRAHGRAVGLPTDDDMGNSEVGHNALGAGAVHAQGALLVGRALASGALVAGDTWQQIVARGIAGGALHFIGLLSDGNVHSHEAHLHALLRAAASAGCRRLFVHALLDGRDVAPTSALTYVDRLEAVLGELRAAGATAAIASGGGRQQVTMDRYEADWRIVERGWRAHVHGEARRFPSTRAAIETCREETPGVIDQDLPAFVVVGDDGAPLAPMRDGDAAVCFNFRGDRAIELSRAFDDDLLVAFDRGRRPDVLYAGMMQYDGDLHLPRHYLVEPPTIAGTMGELLAGAGVPQLAIAETQKYGHVTYFWNGNRTDAFEPALETYVEIPSDQVPFEQRPWMQAAEVSDRLIAELRTGRHRFARVNYANGDMVGHTGSLDATVLAVEAVDLQLARLRAAVDELGGVLVVTADHGNADEMYQHDKGGAVSRDRVTGAPVIKTSHSLAPVPLYVHDPSRAGAYRLDPGHLPEAGIAHVTATCLELLGYACPERFLPSLLTFSS
ncbi:MAG: 2,3-bisphosphoglycerate-independent phosphoglycerate mutase [Kofleriaceae bacterium]